MVSSVLFPIDGSRELVYGEVVAPLPGLSRPVENNGPEPLPPAAKPSRGTVKFAFALRPGALSPDVSTTLRARDYLAAREILAASDWKEKAATTDSERRAA